MSLLLLLARPATAPPAEPVPVIPGVPDADLALFDDFLTGEAAQLASPRTCEPGPGALTRNTTASDAVLTSVASGALVWAYGSGSTTDNAWRGGSFASGDGDFLVVDWEPSSAAATLRTDHVVGIGFTSTNDGTVPLNSGVSFGFRLESDLLRIIPSGGGSEVIFYAPVRMLGDRLKLFLYMEPDGGGAHVGRLFAQGGAFSGWGATIGSNIYYELIRRPISTHSGTRYPYFRIRGNSGYAGRMHAFGRGSQAEAPSVSTALRYLDGSNEFQGFHEPCVQRCEHAGHAGRIVIAYQADNGTTSAHYSKSVRCIFSDDNFRTDDGVIEVAGDPGSGLYYRYGTLIEDPATGYLYAIYAIQTGTTQGGGVLRYRESQDGGASWGAATALTGINDATNDNILAQNPICILPDDHPVAPGRWLMHTMVSGAGTSGGEAGGTNQVLYSDNGMAGPWTRTISIAGSGVFVVGEGSIVLADDGSTLYMWLRAASGGVARLQTSTDGGVTWTTPTTATTIPNPNSRMVVRNIPGHPDKWMMILNDHGTDRRKCTVLIVEANSGYAEVARYMYGDFGDANAAAGSANATIQQYPDACWDPSRGEIVTATGYQRGAPGTTTNGGGSHIVMRRFAASLVGL